MSSIEGHNPKKLHYKHTERWLKMVTLFTVMKSSEKKQLKIWELTDMSPVRNY